MWHLRTKHGTFWLVQDDENKYHLGVNELALGVYDTPDSAIKDVVEQNTGYFNWDSQSKISIPKQITQWSRGEPTEWAS